MCFSTREQICSLYKHIFYGREDPKIFINPIDLDSILHVALERIEFHHSSLVEVLKSLCTERDDSFFYASVKTTYSEHFQAFLELKEKALVDVQDREERYRQSIELEKHNEFSITQNALLKQRIRIGASKPYDGKLLR